MPVLMRASLLLLNTGLPFARRLGRILGPVALAGLLRVLGAEAATDFDPVRPLFREYCLGCHSTEKHKGDLDLEQFQSLEDVNRHPKTWQRVTEQLESVEMPPKDKPQPSVEERRRMLAWTGAVLTQLARDRAGDPGPVVLRRLSNAEYTFTVRDLLGVPDLDPAREFPVDGAAGEGFVNTGNALVMSPGLLTKYLDAAKDLAAHAVLGPDGIRFSRHTTRRDQTEEVLAEIRRLYRTYTDSSGADRVNLQGIVFDTNEGGRLPVEQYLRATLEERDALSRGAAAIAEVARARGLSPKYLQLLYATLVSRQSSLVLDPIRQHWRAAQPDAAPALAREIAQWQQALWKFSPVGHIGKVGGPKAWMEPVSPLVARRDVRLKLQRRSESEVITVHLVTGDAGDGPDGDVVRWVQPRLVAPGKPDLLLRDLRGTVDELESRRVRLFGVAEPALAAATEVQSATNEVDLGVVAARHGLSPDDLTPWLDYFGISPAGRLHLTGYFTNTITKGGGYDFVNGWGNGETPNLVANASAQDVRIPGNLRAHSVAVHPSPALSAIVGWQSPLAGSFRIEGVVQHAHPECGNGVTWSLEVRRGAVRQTLTNGLAQGSTPVTVGPFDAISLRAGDLVSLLIGPRDGNHACDLTRVDLTLTEVGGAGRAWNLAGDVADDVLAGNPHADRQGHAAVWHFYVEPVGGGAGEFAPPIPRGSLASRWLEATDAAERQRLAVQLAELLAGRTSVAPDSPDGRCRAQLSALGGPLLGGARVAVTAQSSGHPRTSWGLDPAVFGRPPAGLELPVDAADLCLRAPSVIEVRLPADLVAGRELVTAGELAGAAGREGTVQMWATIDAVTEPGVAPAVPMVVADGSAARQRVEAALDEFRSLFPAALAYTKIVPVDEVVTLTLYHREDEPLSRLMMSEAERARLDRLWAELHFVSQDALKLVDAFEQLWQFATQDADPKVFEPLREPIRRGAEVFRATLTNAEPIHLEAVVELAQRAWRRPLQKTEAGGIRDLYRSLRQEGLAHDEAIRLLVARVLAAPAFLYKAEEPVAGARPGPVNPWELATRLSYFLWSSAPDAALRAAADSGRLQGPDAVAAEARRLLQDERVRRLAEEFGCAWLHVHGFDTTDEKSERHFPTFAALRGAMYEETIRFFTDLFQADRPLTDVLDGDATFLNEALAAHYGIPGVQGTDWRRVTGLRELGRGGVLGQASVLAKQSGASRTSPILRGNWVSEVLLGEKLPRPPPGVPQLPEDETATEGLTMRQLTERHSADPKCAACHLRIDPFGYALEAFDAIGRRREKDLGNRDIDTHVRTPDGSEFADLAGLREYLLNRRRDAFVRQFCRKLLGYALGRAVQLTDEPLLDEMKARLQAGGYRVSVAVEAVVRSPQFLNIRGREMALDE